MHADTRRLELDAPTPATAALLDKEQLRRGLRPLSTDDHLAAIERAITGPGDWQVLDTALAQLESHLCDGRDARTAELIRYDIEAEQDLMLEYEDLEDRYAHADELLSSVRDLVARWVGPRARMGVEQIERLIAEYEDRIGEVSEIHPSLCESWSLDLPLASGALEIWWDDYCGRQRAGWSYRITGSHEAPSDALDSLEELTELLESVAIPTGLADLVDLIERLIASGAPWDRVEAMLSQLESRLIEVSASPDALLIEQDVEDVRDALSQDYGEDAEGAADQLRALVRRWHGQPAQQMEER